MSEKPTPENDSITSLEFNIANRHDSILKEFNVEQPFGGWDVAFIEEIPLSRASTNVSRQPMSWHGMAVYWRSQVVSKALTPYGGYFSFSIFTAAIGSPCMSYLLEICRANSD
jgi:hypothetical protein